ncbi:hypothetical protein BRADI_1g52737v3 [Brachypodium distachyon]|uniref:Uncharacterized protein n=1 Tax=Brachypodium distachyon TaxID=15368 RepID=A0A2K2DR50_BRADI|nr:hypothetical protein BRADI_1g52737v3 [Brachypodium distachyon]
MPPQSAAVGLVSAAAASGRGLGRPPVSATADLRPPLLSDPLRQETMSILIPSNSTGLLGRQGPGAMFSLTAIFATLHLFGERGLKNCLDFWIIPFSCSSLSTIEKG